MTIPPSPRNSRTYWVCYNLNGAGGSCLQANSLLNSKCAKCGAPNYTKDQLGSGKPSAVQVMISSPGATIPATNASAIISPWSSTRGDAKRATTVRPMLRPFSKPASHASPIDSSGRSSSSSLLSSSGVLRRPRRGGAAAALHSRGGGVTQPWHGAASHTTAKSDAWRIAACASLLSRNSQLLYNRICSCFAVLLG